MKCHTMITIDGGLLVPCGKCIQCHVNRQKDWQFRLSQELKVSDTAHFITLTYNDDNIKRSETGQHTLVKKDVQDFLKRLRISQQRYQVKAILKQFKWKTVEEAIELVKEFKKIRYYVSGEYGDRTYRPHYHGIFYNIDNNILKATESIWKKGTIDIGTVTPESINYVTSYCIKPQRKLKVKEPEFALMSRKPGLGSNYLNAKNYHVQNGETNVRTTEGNYQRLPQFYKDKFFTKVHKEAISTTNELSRIKKEIDDNQQLVSTGHNPDLYTMEKANNETRSISKKHQQAKNKKLI